MDATAGITPASLPPELVAATYDRRAPLYDSWVTLFEQRAQQRTLALARAADGERVLVVGVGTGGQLTPLLSHTRLGWLELVDIAPGMLRLARARALAAGSARYRLVRADARALPYEAGCFDVVLCTYLLDLLPTADLLPVIGELHRVLHPMGRLALATMAYGRGVSGWLWQAFYGTPFSLSRDCRPLAAGPLVERAGFTITARELVVERSFSSEVIAAHPLYR